MVTKDEEYSGRPQWQRRSISGGERERERGKLKKKKKKENISKKNKSQMTKMR